MKVPVATTLDLAPALPGTRLADIATLVRPRVAVMVLVTVLLGGLLAAETAVPSAALVHAVLATGLVTAGASILNQVLERRTDALMPRTEDRGGLDRHGLAHRHLAWLASMTTRWHSEHNDNAVCAASQFELILADPGFTQKSV